MKTEVSSASHGDYQRYLYEATIKSMPNINWFFCPNHGVMRCLNNRWRCPMCNHILHQCTRKEALQLKHGQIPDRLQRKKPKRHYHEQI